MPKKPKKTAAPKTSRTKTILVVTGIALLISSIFAIAQITKRVAVADDTRIYIPTGADYGDLCDTLAKHNVISQTTTFALMSKLRGLDKHVKSGSYVVKPGMTYLQLVQKLYTGNQNPIRITIGKYRTVRGLCDAVATQMEFTPDTLYHILTDKAFCEVYHHTPQTIIGAFTQNTYEVYWNTSPKRFVERMMMETDAFWNDERCRKLEALGLSRNEVVTLASIVEEETNKGDEKADIASVYLNRLRKGMRLEADPTVKYATGDFTLRRILAKHLQTPSPYNTYLNTGLPPGPICLPSSESIDAVLANKKTAYIYFCAKEDFSGYHNFAATYQQHLSNAARYHKALNQRRIK